MAVIQNLYSIFKIPASVLVANDCNIEKYTIEQGEKDENVVSIGDNIIFQLLRYIHGDDRDHHELFNKVTRYRASLHRYKKELAQNPKDSEKKKFIYILENHINKILFVKDIVNVIIDGKKSDFHKFRTKGFYLNGVHYVYLCSGSGQIRRNTATFINEEYHDQIVKAVNCGLDEKTSEFVLAKYSAYFALAFSSILWVRTPRVCVIRDFYRTLPQQNVDFIVRDENDVASIEKRVMDLEINCADGQGLIDPEFAKLWASDMDLPYTPCSFVARSCFIKGNLATFDFKEYAHTHGISTIKDKWGKEYNIDEVDVLLSESQFKTSKYYKSWQEYCDYAERGRIRWGVARYNKKEDDPYVLTNYQYIQSLSLSKEDIVALISESVDWIKNICSGDTLNTLLYIFGPKDEEVGYEEMYGTVPTTAMKAVVKNVDFLNDTYIQSKIYKNIAESINRAKLGKIWVEGNYQFMVSDPVAQCQAALGLDPVGVVKKDQIWSKFWLDRNVNKVDVCRSPMIDVHEHCPSDVILDNAEANYWLRYMNSGIILSTYDTATFRMEDADFDGDIVLTTSNPYFIKGSHKDHNIITYEKGLAKPAKMTIPNITSTVLKGFGTGVGGFSNTATIMYAMSAIFDKPGDEERKNEIMTRIKLLREIVGQEIDRIKGADKPSLPASWKKYEEILETDTQEEKIAKIRKNAMVVSKKPYFFRYLYDEINQRYKQFEDAYNSSSKSQWGIKFKKLLLQENKTEEQLDLVKRYQKFSPLITAQCVMNQLCKSFESVDFDIQFAKDLQDTTKKKKTVSMLPTYEKYFAASFSQDKFNVVKTLYKFYNKSNSVKQARKIIYDNPFMEMDDFTEFILEVRDAQAEYIRSELKEHDIYPSEFLFYTNRVSKTYSNFNWTFAWDVLGDDILAHIPNGRTLCPVRDPEGQRYLGDTYSLREITSKDDILVQKLVDSLLGNIDSTPEAIISEIYLDTKEAEERK